MTTSSFSSLKSLLLRTVVSITGTQSCLRYRLPYTEICKYPYQSQSTKIPSNLENLRNSSNNPEQPQFPVHPSPSSMEPYPPCREPHPSRLAPRGSQRPQASRSCCVSLGFGNAITSSSLFPPFAFIHVSLREVCGNAGGSLNETRLLA